jgi:hypothetical protein
VEAFKKGSLQLIPDTAAEERWPELTRVLRHDGVHAVLSVPAQVAPGVEHARRCAGRQVSRAGRRRSVGYR